MTRRRVFLWTSAALVVLVVAGGIFFQPWRLFTTVAVDEALPPEPRATIAPPTDGPSTSPTAIAPPSYVDLAAGSFLSHEHATSGSVRVVQQPDGSRVLAIAGLSTSDGPDLRVWLTDQPVLEGQAGWHVFDDGAVVELGPLKGNVGDQVYDIPVDADLTRMQSVSIWCARFAVSFGAAALSAP